MTEAQLNLSRQKAEDAVQLLYAALQVKDEGVYLRLLDDAGELVDEAIKELN